MNLAVYIVLFVVAIIVGFLVGAGTGSPALGWAAFLTILVLKLT
jgi:hypothetical protein